MTTIEDKISLFSKIIYDKVNEEKNERLSAFTKESEKKISFEKDKIEKLRNKLQSEVTKKSNIKANAIVAKENLNKQREVLFLKDKLIKETLKNVGERLVEFALSEEYKTYFISSLRKTLKTIDNGHFYIILVKRDYENFKSEIEVIIEEYKDLNVVIEISEDDFTGGLILKDFEGKFRIDNSINSALEESEEVIGVRVMEMLS